MTSTRPPTDDERVPMTADERNVWAYLVAVAVTSSSYLVVIGRRLLAQPVEQVSWVVPMLWTIGLSVALSVLGTVVGTVAAAVLDRARAARAGSTDGGTGTCPPDPGPLSDERDREIGRVGDRAAAGAIAVGFGGALVLAMLDAHTFWIGNLLFVAGTAGALVETVTKIRLYRRGF